MERRFLFWFVHPLGMDFVLFDEVIRINAYIMNSMYFLVFRYLERDTHWDITLNGASKSIHSVSVVIMYGSNHIVHLIVKSPLFSPIELYLRPNHIFSLLASLPLVSRFLSHLRGQSLPFIIGQKSPLFSHYDFPYDHILSLLRIAISMRIKFSYCSAGAVWVCCYVYADSQHKFMSMTIVETIEIIIWYSCRILFL